MDGGIHSRSANGRLLMTPDSYTAIDLISQRAHHLVGTPADFDPLLDMAGDACLVLLSEATHRYVQGVVKDATVAEISGNSKRFPG